MAIKVEVIKPLTEWEAKLVINTYESEWESTYKENGDSEGFLKFAIEKGIKNGKVHHDDRTENSKLSNGQYDNATVYMAYKVDAKKAGVKQFDNGVPNEAYIRIPTSMNVNTDKLTAQSVNYLIPQNQKHENAMNGIICLTPNGPKSDLVTYSTLVYRASKKVLARAMSAYLKGQQTPDEVDADSIARLDKAKEALEKRYEDRKITQKEYDKELKALEAKYQAIVSGAKKRVKADAKKAVPGVFSLQNLIARVNRVNNFALTGKFFTSTTNFDDAEDEDFCGDTDNFSQDDVDLKCKCNHKKDKKDGLNYCPCCGELLNDNKK